MVEEAVEPVAHRVLHRELRLDGPYRRRVAAHPVTQPGQAVVQLRPEHPQTVVRVGGPGVDDRPVGQDEHQRLQRPVRVVARAAGHAAGVVRHDSADGAGDLAGGVGSELAPVGGQRGVDRPQRGPALHPHPVAVVEHIDRPEVPADVDEDPVGDRLAGQAGAARSEGEVQPGGGAGAQQPPHGVGAARRHHDLGSEQHVRGVGRVREPGRRVVADRFGAPDGAGEGGGHRRPDRARGGPSAVGSGGHAVPPGMGAGRVVLRPRRDVVSERRAPRRAARRRPARA